MKDKMKIEDFKEYLGEYGEKVYDGWSGEPVMWGYKILKHLGDDKWKQISELGTLECVYPNWYLITHKLTRDEAIKKYGEQTDIELGVRGGFKSITFGNKRFGQKNLQKD